MLVSIDRSWAICTPKKTGSQSLQGMLADKATVEGDFHGPVWFGEGKRVMVVREPYDRLASMYWFSVAQGVGLFMGGTASEWLRKFVAGFGWKHKASYQEWVTSCSDLALVFRPDVVCRLEDGLELVFDAVGLERPEHIRHMNQTGNGKDQRKSFAETFGSADAATLAAVDEWCKPDLRWY